VRRYPKRGQPREDGYRSQYEATIAKDLTGRGVVFDYEQVTVELEVAGSRPRTKCGSCGGRTLVQVHRYTPDFLLPRPRMRPVLFIEAKGRFTAKDRRLALAFKAQYKDADHAMMFMRDNTLSKSSKTKYSDWCKENDVTYTIGTKVPKEWLQ
jgi:hypothetical protein